MKKHWFIRWGWIVLLILIIAIVVILWYRKDFSDLISFDVDTDKSASGLLDSLEKRYASRQSNVSDKGFGFYLDIPLTLFAKNKSARAVTLQNIAGNISYNGEPIFQTKANSTVLQNVRVDGKNKPPTSVTDTFQVLVNEQTINFVRELIKGKKPSVQYLLKANILGTPYTFENSTIVNKKTETTPAHEAGH